MLRPLVAVTFVWALAMPVVPANAADTVPFHAVINTAPAVVGPCGPTCLALEITGSGQATHLGRMHFDGPSQVDVVSATQTGTSTLMAANGDTLVIEFSGTHVDVWRRYPFHGQEKIIQFSIDTLEFEKYTARIEGEVTSRR